MQHDAGPQRHPAAVNGPHHTIDEVRAVLKHVGPHVVEQVGECVLTAQPCDAKSQVLHHSSSSLPVHQVTVSQGILQDR